MSLNPASMVFQLYQDISKVLLHLLFGCSRTELPLIREMLPLMMEKKTRLKKIFLSIEIQALASDIVLSLTSKLNDLK
jgi:hypothetical protein